MFRHKKGSMELSVNSIVILVIAVVVMGLILAFIKQKLGQAQFNPPTPDAPPASASETVTVSADQQAVFRGGDASIIKVNAYNDWGAQRSLNFSLACNPVLAAGVTVYPPIGGLGTTRSLPAYGQGAISYAFTAIKSAAPQTYLCTATVINATAAGVVVGFKDFAIQVQ